MSHRDPERVNELGVDFNLRIADQPLFDKYNEVANPAIGYRTAKNMESNPVFGELTNPRFKADKSGIIDVFPESPGFDANVYGKINYLRCDERNIRMRNLFHAANTTQIFDYLKLGANSLLAEYMIWLEQYRPEYILFVKKVNLELEEAQPNYLAMDAKKFLIANSPEFDFGDGADLCGEIKYRWRDDAKPVAYVVRAFARGVIEDMCAPKNRRGREDADENRPHINTYHYNGKTYRCAWFRDSRTGDLK